MDRYFCFRFDVDTHRCVRKGVPRLLELSARIGTPFTFFVNMGRAVARTRLLPKLSGGADRESDTAAKLPARVKLGSWDALLAVLLNPRVGGGAPRTLEEMLAGDHEIGLHGGANHAAWQAAADRWPPRRLEAEVSRALGEVVEATGRRPAGFASPGWTSPAALPPILEELGFRYVADAHGPGSPALARPPECRRLVSVRTNICGEPGGVAYIEHLRARGFDDREVREHFRGRLRSAGRLAVVYGHPYFAGVREIDLVEDLVAMAADAGYRVVRLEDAVAALRRDLS